MTDCQFQLNASGFWQCSQCGWVYTRKIDKPPRRNCPKSLGSSPRPQPTRREQLLTRYNTSNNPLLITIDEVERRIDICEKCEQFQNLSCIKTGPSCQKINHWQQKVLTLNCEKWKKMNSKEHELPSKAKMAKNLAKAVTKHVTGGLKRVAVEEYKERLEVCNTCEYRSEARCTHPDCGCFLSIKAWWASETCPLKKWPNDNK